MSIDTTKQIRAINVEVGDEIDLADDEYGDNDMAIFGFAEVDDVNEYKDSDGDLWVEITTSQGSYQFPAGHWIKRRVME